MADHDEDARAPGTPETGEETTGQPTGKPAGEPRDRGQGDAELQDEVESIRAIGEDQ